MEKLKQKIINNHFDKIGRFIGHKKFSYLTNDEKQYIEGKYQLDIPFKEKIYLFINDKSVKEPFCECGSKKTFRGFDNGYDMFCKVNCPYSIKYRKEKAKKTFLEKYGVDNPTHLQKTKDNHWSKDKDKKNEVSEKISKIKKNKSKEEKEKIKKKYEEVMMFIENKNYFNQYDVFNTFENKEDAFIMLNFIKRHFKENFICDVYVEDKGLRKNIKHYELYKVLKLLYTKLLSHKTGNTKIYEVFYTFIKSFSSWNLNKEENLIVNETPKPKYQRRKWRRYFQLKNEIKDLKKKKRLVKKNYFGEVLQKKLNNINNELIDKQKRLQELAEKLK